MLQAKKGFFVSLSHNRGFSRPLIDGPAKNPEEPSVLKMDGWHSEEEKKSHSIQAILIRDSL